MVVIGTCLYQNPLVQQQHSEGTPVLTLGSNSNASFAGQITAFAGGITTSADLNSSGDQGLLITNGSRLGFDQSGTRSWTMKASGGNLNVFSGDGNGGFNVAGLTNGVITDKIITGSTHLTLDTSITARDLLVKTGGTTHLTIDGSDSSATFAGVVNISNSSGATLNINTALAGQDSKILLHEGSTASPANGASIRYDGANNLFKIGVGTNVDTTRLTIERDTGNATFASTISSGAITTSGLLTSTLAINQSSLPNAPSEHVITLNPPTTTNYYGGGISWSEGSNTAASLGVYDAGSGGALGFYIATGNNTTLTQALTIDNSQNATFAGAITASVDNDTSFEFGKAHIGNIGHSDHAGFSHIDQNGTGSYALLQNHIGGTFLNAASGQEIKFRINNSDVATYNSTSATFTGTVNIGGNCELGANNINFADNGRARFGKFNRFTNLSRW